MSTPSPWKFFSMEELSCHCCGQMKMNADFMDKMVNLRLHYGKPLIVTSGYRCPSWDAKIGTSAKPGQGPHTTGHAMDVNIYGQDLLDYLEKALELKYFTGFGLDQKSYSFEKRFVHLDDLTEAEAGEPRPNLWTYGGQS